MANSIGEPLFFNYSRDILSGPVGQNVVNTNLYFGADYWANVGGPWGTLPELRVAWDGLEQPGNDEQSVFGDPLLVDPAGGDFSFAGGSPAWRAASDGTDIGAWQAP